MSQLSREVILARVPAEQFRVEDFAIVTRELPAPGAGQVLVRNRWFRVSVSTRLMAAPEARAVQGIPFPPLQVGDTLADGAIGEVVAVGPDVQVQLGDWLQHSLGWREYAVLDVEQTTSIAPHVLDPVIWLGHGWTAYAGLTRGARLRTGDTVLITSGAGAIGAMAGQMARLLGAGYVIGTTSSPAKRAWMLEVLGYDAVLLRSDAAWREGLAAAAPDGVDLIMDMVGGEQLQAGLRAAKAGARCVLIGALSAELNARAARLEAPVEIDSFQLIIKGVSVRGFSACEEAPEVFEEWLERVQKWQQAGQIELVNSRFHGLEDAPEALRQACAGHLRGVVLVELA